MTGQSGSVSDTYTYEGFGSIIAKTGNTENNYLFAGEQYDPNVNSYYLRARYYNQENGRFITTDPYNGNLLNPHKYSYTKNNPVNDSDPSGLLSLSELTATLSVLDILLTVSYSYAADDIGYVIPGTGKRESRAIPRSIDKIHEGIKQQLPWAKNLAKAACAQTAAAIRVAISFKNYSFNKLPMLATGVEKKSYEISFKDAGPGDLVMYKRRKGLENVESATGHIQTIVKKSSGFIISGFTIVEGHMKGRPNNSLFVLKQVLTQGNMLSWGGEFANMAIQESNLEFHSIRRWFPGWPPN